MNANERFLRYFDQINEDRQIGASTWSDHHPEYQAHLIMLKHKNNDCVDFFRNLKISELQLYILHFFKFFFYFLWFLE